MMTGTGQAPVPYGKALSGEVIHNVRRVRELTGLRLIDAKRLVDSLRIARPEELDSDS